MKVTSTEFLTAMDSIFEQPRTTPRPTPIAQNFKAPVVPEASLILQNGPKDSRPFPKVCQTPPQSYNAWKLRNAPQIDAHDSFVTNQQPKGKENNNLCQNYANFQYAYVNKSPCDTSTNKSLMKKQVRFERPPLVQPTSTVVMKSPNFSALLGIPKDKKEGNGGQVQEIKSNAPVLSNYAVPLSNTYRFPLQNKNTQNYDSLLEPVRTPENQRYRSQFNTKYPNKSPVNTSPSYPIDNAKYSAPYEQMYMGNTPNADLDLSLHDSTKNIPKKPESGQALFEKSTLNCDGIKKFALPDHVLQAERQKMIPIQPILPREPQNFLPDRKLLPHYSQQIFPDRLLINENKTNQEPNGSQQDCTQAKTDESKENAEKKCSCDCKEVEKPEKTAEKENSEPKTDPTVSELLNIVKQQNEQLHILQSQVQMLIKMNETSTKERLKDTVENLTKLTAKIEEKPETDRVKQVVVYKNKRQEQEDRDYRVKDRENEEKDYRRGRRDNKGYKTQRRDEERDYRNERRRDNEEDYYRTERRKEKEKVFRKEIYSDEEKDYRKRRDTDEEKDYRRERNRESEDSNSPKEKTRRNKQIVEHKNRNPKNIVLYKDEQVGTSYDEGICRRITKGNIITKDTKTEKISVGIMTSFQVSVNKPPKQIKYNRRRQDSSSTSEEEYRYPEKVFTDTWHNKQNHSILENDTSISREVSVRENNDYSLDEMGFGEPLRVQEPPLSPNHTIHVEMHDYDSDSEDETSSVDPGWTFYNDILGQVNNLLENSPTPNPRKENQRTRRGNQIKATDCTMEMIKQAEDIRKQGFAGSSKAFEEMNPKEISFAVKQLLMKYMPDEELATVAKKNDARMPNIEESSDSRNSNRFNPDVRSNAMKGRNQRMPNPSKQMKSSLRQRPPNGAKILDITTLKKQPKLL